jgi:hypothetical protein
MQTKSARQLFQIVKILADRSPRLQPRWFRLGLQRPEFNLDQLGRSGHEYFILHDQSGRYCETRSGARS